jgi:hypothetical protein
MTDLSSAYSMDYYNEAADIFAPPASPRSGGVGQPQNNLPPPAGNGARQANSEVYDVNTIHKQIQQEQQMAQLQKQLQQMQQQPKNGGGQQYYEPQPSFFDSLWARRRDMTKYLVLALVVLLGLSMHSALEYQLKKYILENDLTAKNETMVRFGYPVLIFCILWVIKVFMKS